MIWYLLKKFKKAEKVNKLNLKVRVKKFSAIFLSVYIPFFLVFAIVNIFAVINDSLILSSIGYFTMFALSLFLIHIINKKNLEEIDNELSEYKNSLDLLRGALKELNFYNNKKIRKLTEQIIVQKEHWKHSVSIKKTLSVASTSLLIPVVTLVYK